MIRHMIRADIMKARRTVLVPIVFLASLLTFLYECTNFLLRIEVMIHQAEEKQTGLWQIFLYDKQFILSLTIPLSITLAASVIANTEHQGNAWKQLLALPIKRSSLFLGKFALLFLAICLSGVVSYFVYLLFGLFFDLGDDIPWLQLLGDSVLPFLCSIPIMVFQLYLSISIKNQSFAILTGALSSMAGLFFALSPLTKWIPWAYPLNGSTVRLNYRTQHLILNPDLMYILICSFVIGIFSLTVAAWLFARKKEV